MLLSTPQLRLLIPHYITVCTGDDGGVMRVIDRCDDASIATDHGYGSPIHITVLSPVSLVKLGINSRPLGPRVMMDGCG